MFTLQILLSNYDASIRNWVDLKMGYHLTSMQRIAEAGYQGYKYRILNDAGLISVLDWIETEDYDRDYCFPSWTEFSE